MSCSQIVDIEDLVLGTIDDERAAELRRHVRACEACLHEAELVRAERALFEDRQIVMTGPPPELAVALHEEHARASSPPVARLAAQVVQLFRRGHFSAACAAALFVVASLSRLGSGGLSGAAAVARSADGESETPGILASMSMSTSSDESLACSSGSTPMECSDDTLSSPALHASFDVAHAQVQSQALACTSSGSGTTCESSSSVSCATFWQ